MFGAYWRCGPLVIASAALSFSFTALAIKFLGDAISPFETLCFSGLLCLIVLTCMLWRQGLTLLARRSSAGCEPSDHLPNRSDACPEHGDDSKKVALLTLLRAFFGSVATTAFCLSLEVLTLKDAVTLFFTSPVVALLLDWAVLGRSPGASGFAGTAVILTGAVLVTQPPFLFGGSAAEAPDGAAGSSDDAGGLNPTGVALALVAAAANASGFVCINLLRGRQHPLVLTWWYNLVLLMATAALLAAGRPSPASLAPSPRQILLMATVGITQLAAQLCLNRGFQLESAGRGAAINVLQVLFSFALDVAVLGDHPSVLSVAGSGLVASGVLFVALCGEGIAGKTAARGGEQGEEDGEVRAGGETRRSAEGGGGGNTSSSLNEPLLASV